jgi:hypothetical protein
MQTLRERLRIFIRQYYLNKVIKGLMLVGISSLILLLIFSFIEYFGWLGSGIRAGMFYFYLGFNLVVTISYLIIPLLKLIGISKGITLENAADIIGKHFSQIEDKLVNLLQLQEMQHSGIGLKDHAGMSEELLLAAVQQKELLLRPFPFVRAVGFNKSLYYLRYLIPAIIILVSILSFSPEILSDPVRRISKYREHFEKPAPFTFIIVNNNLTGVSKERFLLKFTTNGSEIPMDAWVQVNGVNYKSNRTAKNQFEFEFTNLQQDITFRLNSLDFFSKNYVLRVIQKPGIRNFKVHLQYPAYIHKENEVLDNIGDLIVPRGTYISWEYNTYYADNLLFIVNNKPEKVTSDGKDRYKFSRRILEPLSYQVQPQNQYIDSLNRVDYSIEVIPDEYPVIRVDEFHDSLNDFMIYYSGEIGDDYGFTGLRLAYSQVRSGDTIAVKSVTIQLMPSVTRQRFNYYLDLQNQGFQPGDQMIWYYEVRDNDQISGPKTARSFVSSYIIPGKAELEEMENKMEEDIKTKLEKNIRSVRQIQQDARKLNNELRNKEQLSWQDKEKINQLLNKEQQVKQNIEDLQKLMQQKNEREENLRNQNEEILEKQKKLQEMMEKLMDEETRKLMEEIRKLMESLDKDKVEQMLQKINISNDELNRELERNLEIFKQLELEKDLKESIEALKKLAEEQKKLAEETEKQQGEKEKQSQKQDELNKEFDRISEKLDKIEKNNQELEFPNKLENTDADKSAIKKDMNESLDQLTQGKQKNASQKQKNASDKMEKLSDKLSDMMDGMMEEQIEEDIMTLRQILKNLMHLSFEQEALMNSAKPVSRQDPKFQEIINSQNNLKRDFQVIEDSLVALGKRQTAIQSVVSKEISSIKGNMDEAVTNFLDINTINAFNRTGKDKAIEKQQYAMTSMNNLALLLAEALDNMKDQQNQQKSAKGKQCNKPKKGGGGQSMKQLRQRQQSLNQQLQKMKEEMQQGQQQGKRNSMSEQFARMAAEQEAIRRALGEYMQELQKQGLKEGGNLSELMKQMEKTEEELVNKILNNNTLNRQEDIRTRLLESEKAERERDEEERRESNEAKNQNYSNPSQFLEYKRLNEKEQEMLRYTTPVLQLFYKNKVNEFLIKKEAMQ